MGAKMLWFLCAIFLFSTSVTDSSRLKLISSGTTTIHKDGATHTITKYMVVPENYNENIDYNENKTNLLRTYKDKEEIPSIDEETRKLYATNEHSSTHHDNKKYYEHDVNKQSNNLSNGGFHFFKSYNIKNYGGGAHHTVTNNENKEMFPKKNDSIISRKTITKHRTIYKIRPSELVQTKTTDSANKLENNQEALLVQQENLKSYGNVKSIVMPYQTIKTYHTVQTHHNGASDSEDKFDVSSNIRRDLKKDVKSVSQNDSDDKMNIYIIAQPESDGKNNVDSISVTEKYACTKVDSTYAPDNDRQISLNPNAFPENLSQNNLKSNDENGDSFNLKNVGLPENYNNRREIEQEQMLETADNHDAKKLDYNELYQEMKPAQEDIAVTKFETDINESEPRVTPKFIYSTSSSEVSSDSSKLSNNKNYLYRNPELKFTESSLSRSLGQNAIDRLDNQEIISHYSEIPNQSQTDYGSLFGTKYTTSGVVNRSDVRKTKSDFFKSAMSNKSLRAGNVEIDPKINNVMIDKVTLKTNQQKEDSSDAIYNYDDYWNDDNRNLNLGPNTDRLSFDYFYYDYDRALNKQKIGDVKIQSDLEKAANLFKNRKGKTYHNNPVKIIYYNGYWNVLNRNINPELEKSNACSRCSSYIYNKK